jgi:hypothetical protein
MHYEALTVGLGCMHVFQFYRMGSHWYGGFVICTIDTCRLESVCC